MVKKIITVYIDEKYIDILEKIKIEEDRSISKIVNNILKKEFRRMWFIRKWQI